MASLRFIRELRISEISKNLTFLLRNFLRFQAIRLFSEILSKFLDISKILSYLRNTTVQIFYNLVRIIIFFSTV